MTPLATADGVELEARWDGLDAAERICIFCHPHPQFGGTMTAPLMRAVTEHLVAAGFGVLRFNFRGVGRSGGIHGGGLGEIADVAAAVAAARRNAGGRPVGVAGWSFGAAAALQWQATNADTAPYAGIAPALNPAAPSLPAAAELRPAPRGFIIGDRDQFTSVDEIRVYAESIDATLTVLSGSDHFFFFREDRVATAVTAILTAG